MKENKKCRFRFRFGKSVASERAVVLPMKWKGEKFGLKLNVMKEDVPFLIGMEAMTKMNLKIDISDQSIVFRGKTGKMWRNKSGHLVWMGLECCEDVDKKDDLRITTWGRTGQERDKESARIIGPS